MFSRLSRLAVLTVALAAPAAFAAPDKPDTAAKKGPAVVVRVQSVNDLLKTADYVGTLLPEDMKNQLKQGTDFARALIDEKTGLAGVDVKNPIGLYVTFGEEFDGTPPVVVLVPIADRELFLKTLQDTAKLKVEAPKDEDGVYKTEPAQSPFPVYFRFANGYAYATLGDAANIDTKALAKPADVLGGRPEHLVSATLRIDRLPDGLKKMAIAGAENVLANGKDQPVPNETPAMKEFKTKAIDELTANLKEILEGGEEAALRLNVDPKAQEFALELELSGAKGSKLAKDIRSIRENKSVVGGAISSPEAAFSMNLSVGLPANLRKLFPPVADDVVAQALKQAPVPGEVLTKAEPLIKALMPTVKAGELDAGFALVGPDKNDKYTLVAGMKVVDGKKLEEVIKETIKKELPPEASDLFKLDEETLPGGSSWTGWRWPTSWTRRPEGVRQERPVPGVPGRPVGGDDGPERQGGDQEGGGEQAGGRRGVPGAGVAVPGRPDVGGERPGAGGGPGRRREGVRQGRGPGRRDQVLDRRGRQPEGQGVGPGQGDPVPGRGRGGEEEGRPVGRLRFRRIRKAHGRTAVGFPRSISDK